MRFLRFRLLSLSIVMTSTVATWTAIEASNGFGQEKQVEPARTETASAKKEVKPKFLRIDRVAEAPRALQAAIATYEITSGEFQGAKIDLVGAVHVGMREYYHDLNKRFQNYEAVLYELVADPEVNRPDMREEGGFNPLTGIQSGMKDKLELSFQLDEVDYSAANFVHADMSPSEFGEDMKKRKDGFIGMFARLMGSGIAAQSTPKGQQQQADMMNAMLSNDPMKLRRAMAEQFDTMDAQMAGLADKDGKSTLLTERNRKALEVLQSELKSGKKTFAIFYGAAHLNDMHDRLLKDFQAELKETEWVDAWPLK